MFKPVKIIKDFYDIHELGSEHGINVRSNADFINARIAIEQLKVQKYNVSFEIIIKNRKFKNGFYDLECFTEFVSTVKVSAREMIQDRLKIELPSYISEKDIISCGLIKGIKKFSNIYDKSLSFEQNSILFVFELDSLYYFNSKNEILNFVINNKRKLRDLIEDRNVVLNWLRDEIIRNSTDTNEITLFLDLLQGKLKMDNLLRSIVFNYAFRNYKEFDKETIGRPYKGLNDNVTISEEHLGQLLKEYENYVSELNDIIRFKSRQISIFASDNNLQYIINKVSGLFEAEYEILFSRFNDELLNNFVANSDQIQSYINILMDRFALLFYFKPSIKSKLIELSVLLDKLNKLFNMRYDFDNFKEWARFYINDYLNVYNYLVPSENIYSLLEKANIDSEIKKNLEVKIRGKIDDINTKYEEFLFNNYYRMHQNNNNITTSGALNNITTYYNKSKVILLVIDAMRWDMWKIIKSIFEDSGYVQINDNSSILSMIPSVTSVSRLSLFAVNKFKNIISDKINGNFSFAFWDEEKHFKRYFTGKKIEFANGGKDHFNDLIQKDADIYTFIYTDADELFHGLKDINKDIIKAVFDNQIRNIIDRVEKKFNEPVKIIIATDHGSIDIDNSTSISLEYPIKKFFEHYKIKFDTHGKYLRIFSEKKVTPEIYKEIFDYFNSSGRWHIIEEKDMDKYALPNREVGNEVLMYLIAKYGYHIGGVKGNNVHGGFSMNETIIPFAILEKKSLITKELKISVEGELTAKTLSKLEITVFNDNDYDVYDLKLKMKPIYFEKIISLIPRNSSFTFNVSILQEQEGIINNSIETSYMRMGKEVTQSYRVSIDVKEDPKSRISNSVKKSRSLDL